MGMWALCLLWDKAKELRVRMWISQKLKEFPALTADYGYVGGRWREARRPSALMCMTGKLTYMCTSWSCIIYDTVISLFHMCCVLLSLCRLWVWVTSLFQHFEKNRLIYNLILISKVLCVYFWAREVFRLFTYHNVKTLRKKKCSFSSPAKQVQVQVKVQKYHENIL